MTRAIRMCPLVSHRPFTTVPPLLTDRSLREPGKTSDAITLGMPVAAGSLTTSPHLTGNCLETRENRKGNSTITARSEDRQRTGYNDIVQSGFGRSTYGVNGVDTFNVSSNLSQRGTENNFNTTD